MRNKARNRVKEVDKEDFVSNSVDGVGDPASN